MYACGNGKKQGITIFDFKFIEDHHGQNAKLSYCLATKSQCKEMEHLFNNSGMSVLFAQSSSEISEFILNQRQLLISTYLRWEDFLSQYQPVGLHTRLMIFGMDTEKGWRYLRNTKDYLPQCVYMGITSISDNPSNGSIWSCFIPIHDVTGNERWFLITNICGTAFGGSGDGRYPTDRLYR